MSFPANDRKNQPTHAQYLAAVTAALRECFGDSRSSVKTAARLTGANERAVRNWFDGSNGPSGRHLVCLALHSDAVLAAFLSLSGREHVMDRVRLDDLLTQVQRLLDLFRDIRASEKP